MQKQTIFIALISMMTFFSACDKNAFDPDNGDIPIEKDKRYIHFDAGISTRGIKEGSTLQENFAVIGYQYLNSWANENILAAPNVFLNGNNVILPQQVTYSSTTGLFSYTPLQSWTSNNYSFFAYYPYANSNVKIFDGNGAKQGQPYITYTIPSTSSNANKDPDTMIDVMTASVIDTDVSNSTVGLHMLHRLSAVDISIRNYYEYTVSNKPRQVTIELSSLTIKLTRMNTSAKIYLDPSIPMVPTTSTGSSNNPVRTYTMIGSGNNYTYQNALNVPYNQDAKVAIKQKDGDSLPLLLIPQAESDTGYLQGRIEMVYKMSYIDDQGRQQYVTEGYWWNKTDRFENNFNFTFDRKLEEGRRYEIVLTFASGAVAVQVDPIADWDSKDVEHEFI